MRGGPGEQWRLLEDLLEGGVAEGVFTAAAAAVGLNDELKWQGAAGRLAADAKSPAATLDTVFDLASLTKPLATGLALLRLVHQGRLALEQRLGEVFPEGWLPPEKRDLGLVSLLAHRAGLPAWRPFYQEILAAPAETRATLLERLAAGEPLEHPPETATLYSDLGFMLLKAVVEKAAGRNLDGFCREALYEPVGLKTLGFNPKGRPGGEQLNFAATEPGLIPGRRGVGEVHDENAWAAGGVAGHAGLFGSVREVFALCAALFLAYQGEAVGPFEPRWLRKFLKVPPGAQRALGFDVPVPLTRDCSAGRFFSPSSVGHLGFTGTSFWIDLELGQLVVLLTNRVHLGRNCVEKIKAFRPRFHEAASLALGFSHAYRQ